MQQPVPPRHSFASDNTAGVLPEVMAALAAANDGDALAYGADRWTDETLELFRGVFDAPVEVALCWGGTGANVVGLQALLRPGDGVVCASTAHINVDECGAPERFCGAKLIDVETGDGKLTPDQVLAEVHAIGVEHHVQPRVVSITQSTELGTLYSPEEIAAVAAAAHEHGLYVHLDGARIANATAALGGDLRSQTIAAGVDVMTFGGTKAGAMYGEAVVFCRPELAERVAFIRKQAGQLPSKMRYVAAQFAALLTDGAWLRHAGHANAMAVRLAESAWTLPGVSLTHAPAVNAVFATVPPDRRQAMQDWSFFWDWDVATSQVRWMTHWATTTEDVDAFVAGLQAILS